MSRRLIAVAYAVPLTLTAHRSATEPSPLVSKPEVIYANDNRRPAGRLENGALRVRLVARSGVWYPEGPSGRPLDVAAWAEEGSRLQNPGPLLRVPVGTPVVATLRNSLDRPLTVFGFGSKRGMADSVAIPPGDSRDARFIADVPGVYYYVARSGPGMFGTRKPEDSQLHGAIVVDGAESGRAARSDDRVFVMSWLNMFDSTSKTGLARATMAINGLSWPHTERIDMVQGDSVRWRVINLTELDHPMHLHGFYFRMEGKGNGVRDTVYSVEQQRLAVTEIAFPNQTMTFSWVPTQPGNWIYHCHFVGHISHLASLDTDRGELDHAALAHHPSDRPHQMYGLVLGMRVRPRASGPALAGAPVARQRRLEIRERPSVYGDRPGYAFVLDGTPEASDPRALPTPGSTLLLTRGERVAIMIVNRSREPAAVHWHGIELESYPDGVPDWSGHGKNILRPIPPGDSLTVRFSPPRAGTFMYHSHFNEDAQINSGLYAPIIVLEPGERYDPDADRVFFLSSNGPPTNVIVGPWPLPLLNGKVAPEPIDLRAGKTYRFRVINMTTDVMSHLELRDGDKPASWRAIAKDGATLPPHQATERPAVLFFDPGEIYDFEFTPRAGQRLSLRYGPPDAPPAFGFPKAVIVPVVVRE